MPHQGRVGFAGAADLERRTFFGLPAVPARAFGSSDGESDQPDDEKDQREDPQQLQRESSRAENDDQQQNE
jgi:hypothetical protein